MDKKFPREVECMFDAVSQKLGREACIRQVKNEESYFILDNAFSYFQKADRDRQVGYRTGYCFNNGVTWLGTDNLKFIILHSPIMFSFFQQNFDYATFRNMLEETARYRKRSHHMQYVLYDKQRKNKEVCVIDKKDINDFLKEVDAVEEKYGFAKTIFSRKNSSQHNLGNTFYLELAWRPRLRDIPDIIEKTWNLFLWLYPSKPLFTRDASLYRSMQKIERKCEFRDIKGLPADMFETECEGVIQAAHIKPHSKGGSDKLNNGLWLCEKHHRMTEGRISGSRDTEKIDVIYRQQNN